MPSNPPHATLITGGTPTERLDKLYQLAAKAMFGDPKLDPQFLRKSPDFIVIEPNPEDKKPTVKIEQIRVLVKQAALKPLQQTVKVVACPEFQRATLPAQNALLKTLEEPPSQTILLITCPHPKAILPTITSRCHLVRISSKNTPTINKQTAEEAMALLSSQLAHQLDWAEDNKELLGNRQGTVETIDVWLRALRQRLHQAKNQPQQAKVLLLIGELQKIRYKIEMSNVAPRLGVEVFFTKLGK